MVSWNIPKKNDRSILIIFLMGVILVLISFFILYPIFQNAMKPDYFSAGYEYNLRIAVQYATISNVSLLIPLPVSNGTPQIGSLAITPFIFEKAGVRAAFIRVKGDWYVKITTDAIYPSCEEFELQMDQYDRQEYAGLPYLVNTRYPIGNDSVFLPKTNMTTIWPVSEISTRWGAQDYNPVITEYQIPTYADYTVTNRTSAMRVEVIARVYGYNSWVEQFDSWRINTYRDEISLALSDEAHGWYLAKGRLKSGEGNYLDRNAFRSH